MLTDILDPLYDVQPPDTLSHYTTLSGLKGIVESGNRLYATEMRYLNDGSELRHFADILTMQINAKLAAKSVEGSNEQQVLEQFGIRVKRRFDHGHALFVSSFSEEGNLLSQWRGYCPHGQGVSVGFRPDELMYAAKNVEFRLGQCIYDPKEKGALALDIVSRVISAAEESGPDSAKHPSQSSETCFEGMEDQLFSIAALVKHPIFEEEKEWRVVSPPMINFGDTAFEVRIGKATMIPYRYFQLPQDDRMHLKCDVVNLGPTKEHNLSHRALDFFLSFRCGGAHINSPTSPYNGEV